MSQKVFRIIIFTAGTGMFLSTLDTGIINVALPTLVNYFDSTLSMMTWTITMYTLILVSTIILFGRLSDRIGHLKVYRAGLILFLIASILCGFSTSALMLIISRTIQGLGAAMLQSTAVAIISTSILQSKQGTAFGTLGVLIGLGPVLGPGLGGLLLSIGSWRWIFWINIPFIIFGLFGCKYAAQYITSNRRQVSINVVGNCLLAFAVFALLWAVSVLPSYHFLSLPVLGAFIISFGLFLAFLCYEKRNKEPILDLNLLKSMPMLLPLLGIFLLGGSMSLGFIIPPYFLEEVKQFAPWQVGLINLSAPLGLVMMSNTSGKLLRQKSPTLLMIYGLSFMTVSYFILTLIKPSWSPIFLALLLLIYGLGAGLFMPANTAAVMNAVDKHTQGTIGSVQRMVQNLGIAIYAAVASAFISMYSNNDISHLMTGIKSAWLFAAASLCLVLIIFLMASKRKTIKH